MHNDIQPPILSVFITFATTILSWVSLINAQYALSFILTAIGIVSGVFAIRYYYHAGNYMKQKRENLKNK